MYSDVQSEVLGQPLLNLCYPPSWIFRIRGKALSLTTAIEKETKRKKEKEEIYRFWGYDGQVPPPPPPDLFPPSYISLSPFLPYFIIKIENMFHDNI